MRRSRIGYHAWLLAFLIAHNAVASGTWFTLGNPAKAAVQHMRLLSDGTVLAANNPSAASFNVIGFVWYRLSPDPLGHYVNGEWSDIAPMHDSRLYYASQILRDGRLFVAGGEYGTGGAKAEVYNPILDVWTQINPPASLLDPATDAFLDASSEILPDGRVLTYPVSPAVNFGTLIYDPTSNTWTNGDTSLEGLDEASWVKLPDDSILTVDADTLNSERYIPSLGKWIADAHLPVSLWASLAPNYIGETGPAFLLPNGRAIFFGGTGHTAIYIPSGGTNQGNWIAGPDIPSGLGAADAPGVMMVNGKILLAAAAPPFVGGDGSVKFGDVTSFFEYDPNAGAVGGFTQVSGPTGSTDNNHSYQMGMLALPDGSVLFADSTEQNFPATGAKLYIYVPDGTQISTKPIISTISPNPDGSFHLTGTGLNGTSEGAGYGDDLQANSNYPLIRFLDTNNMHLDYGRTFNWTSTGVNGNTSSSTDFTLPVGLVPQTYLVSISANGVVSDPVVFSFVTPSSLAICPGGSGTISAIPSPQPATYQWLFNGTPIAGQTTSTLNFSNATTNQSGLYSLQIHSGTGTTTGPAVPVSIGVWEVTKPAVTNSVALCQPTSFTVIARGKGTLSAQWFHNSTPIIPDSRVTTSSAVLGTGATQFTLSIANALYIDDATYTIVITDDCGPVSEPPFTLRVTPNPAWVVVATNGPSPRQLAASAYDSDRHVTVLFGGEIDAISGSPLAADTWEFDGTNWTQRFPTVSPPARDMAQMVYDSKRHRCVLFGGQTYTNSQFYIALDTWEWNGTNWAQINTSNAPAWVYADQFSSCYDSVRGQTLIFGGIDNTGRLHELWAYDGTNWTHLLQPGPIAGGATLMAFDSWRNVAVLLGARSQLASTPYPDSGAVWEWNGTQWQEREQSGQIYGGANRTDMMTFDSFRGESVVYGDVFGRVDGQFADDIYPFPDGYRLIWRWNGQQWQADPPTPTSGISNLQIYGTLNFDSFRNSMLLFGGVDDGNVKVTNCTYEIIYQDEPAIFKQPTTEIALLGHTVQLSVIGIGAPPIAYQWKKGATLLTDTANIQGSKTNTLTILSAGAADSGTYQVNLSNLCGQAVSQPISLNVGSGGPLVLAISGNSGSQIKVTWTNTTATLQMAPTVTGPWTNINSATSPYPINPTIPRAFFRLVQ